MIRIRIPEFSFSEGFYFFEVPKLQNFQKSRSFDFNETNPMVSFV